MAPETVYLYSRLVLGTLAVFLAIILRTKTRDAAWILVIAGALTAYIEIIWSILESAGINAFPLAAAVLTALRTIFLITAFLVMIIRHQRHQ